jgi:hypothetical protein
MRRRTFLHLAGVGLVACKVGDPDDGEPDAGGDHDAASGGADAAPGPDACRPDTVLMHDTYAQALYLDGSLGPLTGVVEVAHVIAGAAITFDFWHGHGGVAHRFTLTPAHFAQLIAGQRIDVTTTEVDDHMHALFVDPLDEAYRVPGAPDVAVPAGGC